MASWDTVVGLGAAAVLLLLLLDALKRWRVRHYIKGLPGPRPLPLIGSAHLFVGDSTELNDNLMKLVLSYNESPVAVWMGSQLYFLLDNPEDLQIVLTSSKTLAKHRNYKFFLETEDSLFSADVHIWKPNRRKINGLFSSKYLHSFLPAFNSNNQKFLKYISGFAGRDRTFDIIDYYMGLSLSIISEVAMGYDAKSIENPQDCKLFKMIKSVNREDYMRIYKPWTHPDFIFNLVENKVTKKYRKELRQLTDGVIQQRREYWKKQHEMDDSEKEKNEVMELNNFLDLMLESVDSHNLTAKYLREETLVMIIGGTETTALTNGFCSLMMAMHPEIQKRVQKEMDEVYGEAGSCKEVTEDMLTKFVYLEQVVMETLRRYCVAPIYLRESTQDLKLTTCTVPAGSAIAICAQAMQMNPKYYPDPEKFDPDRWTPEEMAKRHKYSFLTFSNGPRGCIGTKFGLRSVKLTMSVMLRHFSFYTPWKMSDIKLQSELLLLSKNGFPVSIVPRNVCPCQTSQSS